MINERTEPRPMRFVIFGESVVSEWRNPLATTTRAIISSLVGLGHEVRFLETRGNPALTGMLKLHRGAGMRAFSERFPEVPYVTYDLRTGMELAVWLGRELAMADAVIVQETAPIAVRDMLETMAAKHLVRIAQLVDRDSDWTHPFDLALKPGGHDGQDHWGPAVLPVERKTTLEGGPVVVVYDEPIADGVVDLPLEVGGRLVAVGQDIGGAALLPEAALDDVYRTASVAVVAGIGMAGSAAARWLLPLSYGVPTVVVGDAAGLAIPGVIFAGTGNLSHDGILAAAAMTVGELPPTHNARMVAMRLVRQVMDTLSERGPWR